ncbi:MAG: hypothetical protein JNM32_09580 [Dechloromonas sp.]|nr:hypothetical protein [Dechloromonas sp.]
MAALAARGFRRNLGTGKSLSFVRHLMMRVLVILFIVLGYGTDVFAYAGMYHFGDAIVWLWWAGVAFSAALGCFLSCRTADSKFLSVVAIVVLFLFGIAAGVRALAFGYLLLCAYRAYLGNERWRPTPLLVTGAVLGSLLICFNLLAHPQFLRPASQVQGTLALAKSCFLAANWPLWQLTDWAHQGTLAIIYVGLVSGFFWAFAAMLLLRGFQAFHTAHQTKRQE